MVKSDSGKLAPDAQNAVPQQAAQDNLQRIKRTSAAHRGKQCCRMLRELGNLMSVPFRESTKEHPLN